MMKKRNAKRLLALLVCLPILCGVIFFTAKEKKADAAGSYTVDTNDPMQTFDGWGTSLIWWANNVGKYDWEAGSGDTTVREEIMELLYGKDGLEYNIARFNVGGGDNPNHDHVTKPQHMEGYSTLDSSYLPTYSDNVTEEVQDWNGLKDDWSMEDDVTYVWENNPDYTEDAAQRWCMEWIYDNAEKLGKTNELITEYFSNSPPWYMTKSACASGAVGSTDKYPKDNLLKDREHDFAIYFTEVLLHLINDKGYTFQYVDPFNESTSGWWPARSQKQEGCYLTDRQRADVLYYLVQELNKHSELNHIKIAFDDSTGADKAWSAYNALKSSDRWNTVKPRLGKLNYHLYEGSAAKEKLIAEEAVAQGWQNWMSEMGYKSDKSATSSILQTGYLHTDKIRETIYNGANAYVLWQVIEELSSQLNNVEYGYGPIKVSYYSAEEVPELRNSGYDLGSYYLSKQYYMLGQYSKYIRPGYKILPTSDEQGVAAISPDGKKVVVVHANNDVNGNDLYYTFNGHYIKNAQVIVTDENRSWAKSSFTASGNKFSYTVTPYSVTTFVFDVEQYAEKPRDIVTTRYEVLNRSNAPSGTIKNSGVLLNGQNSLADTNSLPAVSDIFDSKYQVGKIYLTKNWAESENNASAARYYVQGGSGNSTGGFIKFTGATDAHLEFFVKNEDSNIKTELYVKGASAYTKVNESSFDNYKNAGAGNNMVITTVGSQSGLDKTKEYLFVFYIQENNWANISGCVVEDIPRTNYGGPDLTAATVRNGNLYVNINDATSSHEYKVWWREVGTTTADSVTKTVAQMSGTSGAVATGLTGNAYEVWATDTAETLRSQTVTVHTASVDNKLLYYVDAATANVGNYSIYERAAVHNTYKDQAFGADPITGKRWGMTSTGNKKYASGAAGTVYQAMGDLISADGNSNGEIVYKFEVGTTGTFDVLLSVLNPWAARNEEVTVNGTLKGKFRIDKANENFISITNIAPDGDGYITIKVSKPSGEKEGALLGTIMIAKNGDTATAFATAAELRDITPSSGVTADTKHYVLGSVTVDYADVITLTKAYIYGVNCTKTEKTTGVTFDRFAITSDVPNTEAARITGVVDGLYFDTPLTLACATATVYYNVDCGTNGNNPATLGTLQGNGEYDKALSDGSWGYSGNSDTGWADEDFGNSIRWHIGSNFKYTFTQLPVDGKINVEVGGRSYSDWKDQEYEVWFGTSSSSYNANGNKKLGVIDLPEGAMPKLIVKDIAVTASTYYMYFHGLTSGQQPSVSYIKITTAGDTVPSAPTLSKSEAKVTDTVTVSNLPVNDLLVLTADDGSRIKEMKITQTSIDIDLSTVGLPEGTQAVMFSVRHYGSLEESVPTMLALPSVLVSGIKEGWSNKMLLHFSPSMGVTLQKLVIITPSGKRADVTKREYFNYLVTENGEFTVYLTTKTNEIYTQTINVNNIDVITINASYNAALTDEDVVVTVTLDCSDGALDKFYIDNVEQAIQDSYTITATENATYLLKATSKSGNEYEYELNVGNIDKAVANYTLTPDFTQADGFAATLVSGNISGGTFTVTKGQTNYVAKNGLHLVEAGEYTVTYTSGVGKQKIFTVTLGYGAGSLGTLSGNTLSGLNGAKVYCLGTGTEVTVTDGSCTLTAGSRYMILSESNGNYEASIITVEAAGGAAPTIQAAAAAKKGCGSAAGAGVPMAAVVLLLAGAVIALAKKGGKRA